MSRSNRSVYVKSHPLSHSALKFEQKIPPLSLNYPPGVHPDRSLVRFHAMIQDVPSPEVYLSSLPDGRCGGWGLYEDMTTPNSVDIKFHNLRECSVFWAITIPGESQWYAKRLEGTLFDKGHTRTLPFPPCSKAVTHLTGHRHKLPNPQSADFGILLKVGLPV